MSVRMSLLPRIGAVMIRCLGRSWRIRVDGAEHEAAARRESRNVIYAAWHGRMLPITYTLRNRSICVLASEHRDGETLGRTIERLGFGHVRGSSTRGGARAVMDLAEKLKHGFDIGITVDGPRGPRYVAKPGPVQIAKITGAAIVPITSSSRRHRRFSSWDAFELPFPFTEVRVRHGEPVWVPADCDAETLEAKRLELEAKLRDITRISDEGFLRDRGH
jgi:lysophospholipid acyltransferase (LPLAT)-like uncharacterized protein